MALTKVTNDLQDALAAAQPSITSTGTLTGLTVTGEITANGGIALGDGDAATFGDSDDLSIFHAGGSTYLTNTTGSLVLRSDSFRVLNTANSEQILHGDANGAVTAYFDNAVKLATTAIGINVNGTVTADDASGTATIALNDSRSNVNDTAVIDFRHNGITGSQIKSTAIEDFSTSANRSSDLSFHVRNNGTIIDAAHINASGNVGIAGQTNPTYKLDGGFANQTWGWYLNSSYNAGMTYNTTERSLSIHTKSADVVDHIKFATGGSATERMRIDSAGRVTQPYQPYGKASSSSAVTAGNFAALNNAVVVRGGIVAGTNRFTVPVAGAYQVTYNHLGENASTQGAIYKNGARVNGTSTQETASGGNGGLSSQSIIVLAANDYIQYQCRGGKFHGNADYNSMTIHLLG